MNPARERGMAIAMLVEAFALKDLTPVRIKVYDEALAVIPIGLLEPAVKRAIATRVWFPKPAELIADAETCRREIIAANPYMGCVECEDRQGWREITDAQGYKRMERCPCKARYVAKLEGLGVTTERLLLPAAKDDAWTAAGDVA